MLIYFIENENPARNSSGGIMSYILDLSEYLMEEGIETVLLGSGERIIGKFPFSDFISVTKKLHVSNFKYLLALIIKIAILRIEKSAIIHAQRPDMLFPFILFNKKNILVCTLHGSHDIAVFYKKGLYFGYLYNLLQILAFKKVKMLIAVDEGTKNHYLKKYPWVKNKIVVVPTGVDFKKFFPQSKNEIREKYHFSIRDKIIIYIGRLEKEKNLSMLIKSFSKIKKQMENAKLLLVGQGKEENLLRLKVKKLNLNDVIFWGEAEREKIPELLNCADVLVLCSLYEGSPMVLKEALACNVPVVSVDVGDAKEVIGSTKGSYISKKDLDEFSRKIIRVLKDNNKICSREDVYSYSKENISKRILDIYNFLLQKKLS